MITYYTYHSNYPSPYPAYIPEWLKEWKYYNAKRDTIVQELSDGNCAWWYKPLNGRKK